MSKLHILEGGDGRITGVIHVPVPAGTNSASVTWQNALLASGRSGTTILTTGTAGYQISAAELATVQSGAVVEFVISLPIEGLTMAILDAHVTAAIAEFLARQQQQLKWFGTTRV